MAKLYIVPTPIGNLEDITLRALNVLRSVDFVLAEDTRKTGFLLKHFQIETRMAQYHKFNEHKSMEGIISRIESSGSVALVSDAGTPGISDPGYLLVRHCLDNDIEVECLPGATAFVPALVNSGLPNDRFIFEGFLPQKKGRMKRMEANRENPLTMVYYESPHRLVKALTQFSEVFGEERRICVSRELSKLHEENFRGTIAEAIAHFSTGQVKGEIVIVLEGFSTKKTADESEDEDDD